MIMRMVEEGVQGVNLYEEWDIRVGTGEAFSAIEKLYLIILNSRPSR